MPRKSPEATVGDRLSLRHLQKETTLLTPGLWTYSLQKYKRINFYSFKPPNGWSFVMAALENKYTGLA